ncbi:MAG: pseudouridine synthase [Crocinitomicaceae bacterium]|nr:rRNA pseudouridine synthase [Crocinitomicaceae bacterium]MDG1350849.1 pseudouridine synthase [Crocinitomicaceae bacterium]MDG1735795.1 pseudouridine synthase [Crocinitomicaceae bacterium]MDG2506102.1 pseudouridine synthase [Crocinitomicaceae bacterium]
MRRDKKNQQPEKNVSKRDKRKYIEYKQKHKKGDPLPSFSDEVRLNKFISNAGICSRREADVLIAAGVVMVNNKVTTELGFKVKPDDEVKYDGETIKSFNKRYVLLNKPKGFYSTLGESKGRKTAVKLVQKACKELLFPVDKLDKDATGLLLFTNDSDLSKKLNHPRFQSKKLYHVELNKPVTKSHLNKLIEGVDLEDGKTKVLSASHVEDGTSREVGVEISSGKKQVLHRMFEAMGMAVVKLDRVRFSGLTKKDLPRGMHRHLTENEISFLKMSK